MALTILPLTSAVFTVDGTSGLAFGQYGDGVIYGVTWPGHGAPQFPDFYFERNLDAALTYQVEVTFDAANASGHDSGGRGFWLTGVQPGHEEDYNTSFPGIFNGLYDGGGNSSDVALFTIGPGVGSWDDPDFGVAAGFNRIMFETDHFGAVSQIRITGAGRIPPLRLTNRDDMFASAPSLVHSRSRQGGNRLTGYL